MSALDPSNGPIIIDVEDELEGELVSTTDYFFSNIGDSVPLKGNMSDDDLKTLTPTFPSHPLALSERLRLIFVAHLSGFFVVRTKDVIDSAKRFKDNGTGSSVEDLRLADVSIGRVHILALSTDNSLLAASASGHIRFYSVDSFVNKEVKQSFSCSLSDDSAFVKDMRWITTSENSFVVLSNTGDLYYGEAGLPLKSVMDSVEAVDWGVKGEFVAVARKNNVLSILSAKKFEEWVSISLCFKSWIGGSAENCSAKVDSVKCIRPDSIIIGCFQLDKDGKEKNYLVQVIRSRAGEITRGCSDFVVQSFSDIYQGLNDGVVSFGGPYLLLSYIEQCQLAINANIKNTDQHITLLGWSVDDDHKNEVVVVDIDRDSLVPRIELPEQRDKDNLLLGLCVDNVSIYEKVGVQLGVEEERTELSPYCVLICLTSEGKLVMFHVASQAGSEVSQPEVVSASCDEEDASIKPPADKSSTFSHESQKQELDQASEERGSLKSKNFASPYQITHAEDFTKHQPEVVSALCDEEDASIKPPADKGSTFSHESQKQELDQASEESGSLKSKNFANPYQITHAEDFTKHQPEVVSGLCDVEDASIKPPADKGSTFSHESQKQELDQASEESGSLKSKNFANPYQITHAEDFTKHQPEVVSGLCDVEDASIKPPADKGSTFSHESQKQELDQASEESGSLKSKNFANPYQITHAEDFTKHQPEVVSGLCDVEDASIKPPADKGSTFSHESQKQELDQASEESGSLKSKNFANPYQITHAEDFTKHQPEVVSALCDEEDASIKPPADKSSTFSHESQKQELDQASEESGSLKSKNFANPYQITHAEDFTKHQEVESVATVQSLKSNVKQMVPYVDLNKETDSHNSHASGEQQINTGHKTVPLGSSIGSFPLNSHSAALSFSSYVDSKGTTEVTKVQRDTNSSWDTQRTSHLSPATTNVHNANNSQRTSHLFPGTTNVHNANDTQRTSHPFAGTTNVFGSIGGKSLLSHDASGVSPAINSASRPVQRGGQLTSIGAGNMQPVSVTSSPLLADANSTAGKSSIRKFHPSNEQHGASSKLGISSSDLSKQFGNINEMTNELDLLLRSIDEAGGFRDACTRSLRSSIETVEQGMDALSKSCKIQTCQVDEHLKEVHYLLNKTIQVVARKIYMEGIYKQASDSQYWDLWNRQKLNSELELKRQHILSLNQDLTYQLIELERHFNALELNKFSQNDGSRTGHGAFRSRYGPSKNIQSLHSLHNAISSQLVAAENLSECLSKQMSDLSLRSLSEKQKNVKELFETIGLPYDASFGTPDMKGFMRTSSSKNLLFSDFSANNDKCKRIQGSAMKHCESEMSRRRRDSLDRSWTCFEPPKTTIKRKLLQQELQKPNWNEPSFSVNKENVKTSMPKESAPHQADAKFPSIVFPDSNMKVGTLDSHSELEEASECSKPFLADNFRAPTQVSESKSHVPQRSNISAFPSWSASQSSPVMVHGHSTEAKDLAAEKLNVVQKFDSTSNSENKSILHTKMPPNSSISTYSNPETPSRFKSSEVPIKNSKMTMATSSMVGNKLPSAFTPESWRKHDFPTSELHSSSISSPSTLFGKGDELSVAKSQSKANISAQPTFGGLFESPSFPTIKTSSAASPLSSSVLSAALPSAAVSVGLSRGVTSSNTSIDLTSESLKSEIQPAAVSNLKTNFDAASEVVTQPNESLNGKAELKLGSSGKSSPTDEQSSNNATSSALNVVRDSQSDQPSDASMQFSNSFLAPASVSSGKNGGLDFGISDEDEMEEEAPETSNTTELNVGSLGGFGIGSTPNPSVPKPNPFGGSFSNVATSSSSPTISFSVVPGGELFRPASFSFPSSQPSTLAQSTNSGAFSGGFGAGATVPAPNPPSAFGQPAQIGSGQQVLGSVLGSFGQSRQLGSGQPGSGFAAPSGFGGGFAGSGSPSGFPSAATGGGFAGIASTGGGFAGIASAGGGFAAAAASTGSGFSGIASAGGGFGAAAPTGGGFGNLSSGGGFGGAASGGGGFGAFSNQQGSGGFPAFGAAGGSKPPELFTQMRK